jgi:hypothetical protein
MLGILQHGTVKNVDRPGGRLARSTCQQHLLDCGQREDGFAEGERQRRADLQYSKVIANKVAQRLLCVLLERRKRTVPQMYFAAISRFSEPFLCFPDDFAKWYLPPA